MEFGWYLPALICCFEARASSCCKSSLCDWLKTTGALDIVPGAVVSIEGSRRLAYNESPAFVGFPEVSEAIEPDETRSKAKSFTMDRAT